MAQIEDRIYELNKKIINSQPCQSPLLENLHRTYLILSNFMLQSTHVNIVFYLDESSKSKSVLIL